MNPETPNHWQPTDTPPPSVPPVVPTDSQPQPIASQPQPPVAQQPSQPESQVNSLLDVDAISDHEHEQMEDDEVLEWDSPEYIHHDKTILWYIVLVVIVIASAAGSIFFKQYFFTAVIIVMGIAVGFFAARPPRDIHYRLTDDGVEIGGKLFNFESFRSFGILADDSRYSIVLRPIKRLGAGVAIYFSEAEGEKIVDILAAYLPVEEISQDPFDRLMHKLHF